MVTNAFVLQGEFLFLQRLFYSCDSCSAYSGQNCNPSFNLHRQEAVGKICSHRVAGVCRDVQQDLVQSEDRLSLFILGLSSSFFPQVMKVVEDIGLLEVELASSAFFLQMKTAPEMILP